MPDEIATELLARPRPTAEGSLRQQRWRLIERLESTAIGRR